MESNSKITKQEFEEELLHAEQTTADIIELLKNEVEIRDEQAKNVTDDREYFIDYFREMHQDEREDWLQFEHYKLKRYDKSVQTIQKLGRQLNQPYFGKVGFKEEHRDERKFYIGIYSLMKDFVPVIIDWRAPICSLYYESEPGEASYTPASGEKKGLLTEKKRFTFKDGHLASAANINLPSDDEFLHEILSENASDRLKVIVQSLQKDQNRIVRDFVDGVHIIAGCAGSGKSSVAMHKIAFIMYSFRDKLKDKDIVVLSPNNIFSAYISHILPDLGEDNVFSLTQEELIDNILLPYEITCSSRDTSMERMLTDDGSSVSDSVKFKNSGLFLKLLDRYASFFATHCFTAADLEYENGDVGGVREYRIKKEDLDYLFHVTFEDVPVTGRIDAMLGRIITKNHISNEETIDFIKASLESMICEIRFDDIYRAMYTNAEFREFIPSEMAEMLGDFERHLLPSFGWEDAVGIAYLITRLAGSDDEKNVFYLFCDEAQDLSPAMLAIIKSCYGKANMLFAGDLHQNVFANSEDYADVIKKTFPGKHFKKYELNVNYRSTKQISEFATGRSGRTNEISCVREGRDPAVIKTVSESDYVGAVENWIRSVAASDYERCAVLAASMRETENMLEKCEIPADIAKGKLNFMPVYLAKGLEFDAVLLLNRGGEMEKLDAKLGTNMFYTAATRAMHDLTVIE